MGMVNLFFLARCIFFLAIIMNITRFFVFETTMASRNGSTQSGFNHWKIVVNFLHEIFGERHQDLEKFHRKPLWIHYGSMSQRIHGTGIFTYIDPIKINHSCREIYREPSHGWYGYGSICFMSLESLFRGIRASPTNRVTPPFQWPEPQSCERWPPHQRPTCQRHVPGKRTVDIYGWWEYCWWFKQPPGMYKSIQIMGILG